MALIRQHGSSKIPPFPRDPNLPRTNHRSNKKKRSTEMAPTQCYPPGHAGGSTGAREADLTCVGPTAAGAGEGETGESARRRARRSATLSFHASIGRLAPANLVRPRNAARGPRRARWWRSESARLSASERGRREDKGRGKEGGRGIYKPGW